jgi:hypothetical protein
MVYGNRADVAARLPLSSDCGSGWSIPVSGNLSGADGMDDEGNAADELSTEEILHLIRRAHESAGDDLELLREEWKLRTE